MAFRGHTRSTWQPRNQEDIDVSETSYNNLNSRSSIAETVIETDDEATDQLSLKLNRLTEKLCRYESHKYFIDKCLNPFNVRLNNHRKDINNVQATLTVRKHFHEASHSFNQDAKFTLIEQIKNQKLSQKDMRKTPEDHEDLWILKLGTLRPNGLNDKLNHPENVVGILYQASHAHRQILGFIACHNFCSPTSHVPGYIMAC